MQSPGGNGGSRAERYLDRMTALARGREPRILPVESTRPGQKLVTALCFADTPEPGLMTGFTYGLSVARHPLWRFGRPELAITVQSADVGWPVAVAIMAERLRGDCPFEFGNTVNIGEPITAETEMTGFAIFAPLFPEDKDDCRIEVGADLPIFIAGCYPIHRSEMDFITERGLEEFWRLDWDPFDIRRQAAV
jgi:hypothetical protein